MRQYVVFAVAVLSLSGCVIPQDQPLGSNADPNRGYNHFGVQNVRSYEGPLSDLMVPDAAPNGIGSTAQEILRNKGETSQNYNLSMSHEGINNAGSRILSNKPGIIRDKPAHQNNPNLEKRPIREKSQVLQSELKTERAIEQRVEQFAEVRDAHVISDGNVYVIGVESTESDRVSLIQSIEKEVAGMDEAEIYITTNRRVINRIKALEHHISLPQPLESIGGAVAEMVDLIDDTTNHRR
ncbi:YhcN/YlaJ family sporulation lipoprotein [Bacillus suaedae]|uniref:YhcN/YlaJ family sporulation lipoprotein n=1 Tax=Halalkalibacter suaedae TaxID=2822140 RepID=A0A940WQV8_9BACI|nr:YhcN/YlaJ family sporulation lipoprotein [Bacillus suaedae]MBP3950671.1 YhcN/YlaJ family sporulation lipoprotein [Bacillus suaedae]